MRGANLNYVQEKTSQTKISLNAFFFLRANSFLTESYISLNLYHTIYREEKTSTSIALYFLKQAIHIRCIILAPKTAKAITMTTTRQLQR